ncbi:MAG: hypothetical protein ACYC0L_04605 [Thermoleophilia bacterium]
MTAGLAALNSWGISEFQKSQANDPVPVPGLLMSVGQYLDALKDWEHRSVETILSVLSDFFLIAALICLIAIIPSLFLFGKKSGTRDW